MLLPVSDSLILYDNLDKTGSQTVITASGDMDSFWLDRASSLTVTGTTKTNKTNVESKYCKV